MVKDVTVNVENISSGLIQNIDINVSVTNVKNSKQKKKTNPNFLTLFLEGGSNVLQNWL